MNISNVIKALRQSRKLQPISVYCQHAKPSILADRLFFDEVTQFLKLLLKAFKQAGFEANLSTWGELTLFSSSLGIEVLIRIEPNTTYMNGVSTRSLETIGYQVSDVQLPKTCFILRYFFCGTKSKWREISFNNDYTTAQLVYEEFVLPIIQNSKPFQGRLSFSLQAEINQNFNTQENVYAFARFANKHVKGVFGLSRLCYLLETKYVRECFFNDYGALVFTSTWRDFEVIIWQKNDKKFVEKYIPNLLTNNSLRFELISMVTARDEEHRLLLSALDKTIAKSFDSNEDVDAWFNERYYFTDKTPPRLLLNTNEGALKVLLAMLR